MMADVGSVAVPVNVALSACAAARQEKNDKPRSNAKKTRKTRSSLRLCKLLILPPKILSDTALCSPARAETFRCRKKVFFFCRPVDALFRSEIEPGGI